MYKSGHSLKLNSHSFVIIFLVPESLHVKKKKPFTAFNMLPFAFKHYHTATHINNSKLKTIVKREQSKKYYEMNPALGGVCKGHCKW